METTWKNNEKDKLFDNKPFIVVHSEINECSRATAASFPSPATTTASRRPLPFQCPHCSKPGSSRMSPSGQEIPDLRIQPHALSVPVGSLDFLLRLLKGEHVARRFRAPDDLPSVNVRKAFRVVLQLLHGRLRLLRKLRFPRLAHRRHLSKRCDEFSASGASSCGCGSCDHLPGSPLLPS